MDNIDFENLNDQELAEIYSILKGMDDGLKEMEDSENEAN